MIVDSGIKCGPHHACQDIFSLHTFSVNQQEFFMHVCVLIPSVVRQLRAVHLLQSVELGIQQKDLDF